jgi:hypothetical protein
VPTLSDMGPPTAGDDLGDAGLTEAELTALALAADPDAPVDPDAVPLGLYLAGSPGLLPQWYMPEAMARGARWRTLVVILIIAAFLLIDAAGLCSTYGHIVIA